MKYWAFNRIAAYRAAKRASMSWPDAFHVFTYEDEGTRYRTGTRTPFRDHVLIATFLRGSLVAPGSGA